VSLRRPLPRRFDTIARPARVRIRSRNPCTRARRRLPLATAVHSLCVWHPQPTPMNRYGVDAIAVGKLVRLASRRGLQKLLGRSRIATCGRLFEGTDEIYLGQTPSDRRAKRDNRRISLAPSPGKNLPPPMLQNGWH
jgi:hypothetical protein